MTNDEITFIVNSNISCKKMFIGVFAADTLPTNLSYPCTLIVNTDDSNLPGQHWVAIHIDKKRIGYFFDSYGMTPYVTNFINFLNKFCDSWKFNSKPLQSINTIVCGQYCCLFVLACSENAVVDFLKMYSTNDSYSNDAKTILKFNFIFVNKKKCMYMRIPKLPNCTSQSACARVKCACAL